MAAKVHVWTVLWAKAEDVRVYLAEIDPDLLSVLSLVDFFELIVIKANFGSAHVECNQTNVSVTLSVAKMHLLVRIFARVVHYISAPSHTFALVIVILVVFALLVLICIKERLIHHGIIVVLIVLFAIIILIVMLRKQYREVLQVLVLAELLLLPINNALFFDSITILNKLVI